MSVEQNTEKQVEEGLFDPTSYVSPQPEPERVMGVVEAPAAPEAAAEVKPAPPRDEHERLDPQPLEMKLLSGTEFELEALKLRQFLRLLRIVTRGASDVLDTSSLDFENPQEFLQTFLGMVLFSIPEAEEETIDFIKSMVRPKDMTGNPEKDLIKVRALGAELNNPELEDTITIIQVIIEREGEDLRALGKRLGSMLKVADKMGATKSDSSVPKSMD